MRTMMVIDDEPGILEAFEAALEGSYELDLCGSVEDAMALPAIRELGVGVIFLDGLFNRGVSGERALPWLKKKFPKAIIIYIGGSAPFKADRLRAAGVSVLLPKPWGLEELLGAARLGMAMSEAEFE